MRLMGLLLEGICPPLPLYTRISIASFYVFGMQPTNMKERRVSFMPFNPRIEESIFQCKGLTEPTVNVSGFGI